MKHRTFLNFFVIMLAAAGAATLATLDGIPQAIYASDASHVTSAIAALFAVTAVYLGFKAITFDYAANKPGYWELIDDGTRYGHWAEKASVLLGMLGTIIGLEMQLRATHGSIESLAAFATQFSSTGCGIVAAGFISLLVLNLEAARSRMESSNA